MVRSRWYLFLPVFTIALSPAARAQDGSTSQSAATAPPTAQPAQKKVWTNDDVTDLRGSSPISTVGSEPAGGPTSSGRANSGAANHKDAKWYHEQIEKLQNQLAALNAKIDQLQAGVDGKTTGDGKESTRPLYAKAGDWRAELAQLQNQRDSIEARIEALRNQARRTGIPTNALP